MQFIAYTDSYGHMMNNNNKNNYKRTMLALSTVILVFLPFGNEAVHNTHVGYYKLGSYKLGHIN